jgi:transposase
MPAPLSEDLRLRVVRAWDAEKTSYAELAERFQIGEASVSRILRLHRETGGVEPRPHGGGNPARIQDDELSALHALVDANADATQQELAELWFIATGNDVSRSGMSRALRRAGITRKKSDSVRGSSSGPRSKRRGGHSSS